MNGVARLEARRSTERLPIGGVVMELAYSTAEIVVWGMGVRCVRGVTDGADSYNTQWW